MITKPKVSAEFVEYFLRRFRDLDVSKLEHRRVLIDTFINSIFLYEDRMIITFNYRDGQKIITFADLEGSDLKLSAAPTPPENRHFSGVLLFDCSESFANEYIRLASFLRLFFSFVLANTESLL